MRYILFILLFPSISFGKEFDARVSEASTAIISWEVVGDVDRVCRKLARDTGRDIRDHIEGCSVWRDVFGIRKCVIVIGERVSHDTLGHEVRHCFQGDWHK